jgi:hypothetical protein
VHRVEILKESYRYDADNGVLVWAVSRGFIRAGKVAGGMVNGAMYVTVDGKRILAKDVVWYLVRGHWPKSRLYHKNGDKSDISIENLTYKKGVSVSPSDEADFGICETKLGYTVTKLTGDKVEVLGTKRGLDDALAMMKGAILCSR